MVKTAGVALSCRSVTPLVGNGFVMLDDTVGASNR